MTTQIPWLFPDSRFSLKVATPIPLRVGAWVGFGWPGTYKDGIPMNGPHLSTNQAQCRLSTDAQNSVITHYAKLPLEITTKDKTMITEEHDKKG